MELHESCDAEDLECDELAAAFTGDDPAGGGRSRGSRGHARALEMGGYRVLEAGGPEAATRAVSDPSIEIDLLLTDVVMPGMSGPELAHHVSATRPGLVTIFMSGYAESETLRGRARGPVEAHPEAKPFTVDGLLAKVAEALASRWGGADRQQTPQFPSP